AATLRLTGDGYNADLQLSDPIADLFNGPWGRAQVLVRGDLGEWQKRLQPWVSALDGWHVAGSGELKGGLRGKASGFETEDLQLAVSNFSCQGPPLNLNEPGARVFARCRYVPAVAGLELDQIRYEGPALVCEATGKLSQLGSRNDLVIAGQLRYDLE